MEPKQARDRDGWHFPRINLTGGLLLLTALCAGAVLLPSVFSQAQTPEPHKPTPPSFPAPVVIDANHPATPGPAPVVSATPAAAPAASASPAPPAPAIPAPVVIDQNQPLPTGPNSVAPAQPPPTINGNPNPPAPGSPAPPAGLPPVPIVIPSTVILEAQERNGNGSGPLISVSNEPHAFSRAGLPARNWIDQTQAQADAKSVGCLQCHQGVEPMHKSAYVVLGCTDCHGGNAQRGLAKEQAHVQPVYPEYWKTAANPEDSSTILNHESPEFVRFKNPGDLRVAEQACGLCHKDSLLHVTNSMMNGGPMLWGAALYNNGAYWKKNYVFGQFYGRDGAPLRVNNPYPVTPEMTRLHGILPFLMPLPRFNLSQPSNTLRVFEKGAVNPPELGNPEPEARNGAPERSVSARGEGTNLRVDPVFIGLQKTRLNDPLLGFFGTNDHPGDYRSSGCTGCHTVYANDRSPTNSGWYSKYGHQGLSFSGDPTMDKHERGHPITHQFTRSIPSSQCMSCHMHQGNLFVNPYLGYTWWDQESDGEFMYPKKQHDPTDAELLQAVRVNPEAAAARGLWGDLNFLDKVAELNPKLKNTQFADYHSHGWVFRAIFKKDRQGNLLDLEDNKIASDDPQKWQKAVHLNDIHLQKGMQCADCHFLRDVHGDGTLYGEPRAATSIECIDCHGTVDKRPTLITSGNGGQVDIGAGGTPFGPRFVWEDVQQTVTDQINGRPVERLATRKALYQYSSMEPDKRWEVPQTIDTINPASPNYNAKSAYAKTLHRDGSSWGDVPADPHERKVKLAHNNEAITCQICHSSWATSCFGCHLPQKANQRIPLNKFEGTLDRNFTTYNPQVVRDDVFMLGIDGTVKNNRMAVLRSSSAVIVSSQNANREQVYSQQQTVSAEGYSGQAFNPHFPHTTSSVGTTKNCTDCHLAAQRNNNAWMTQLLGFGTGTVNFFGRYAWTGLGPEGIRSIIWTEFEEPQAAIGSHLQKLAYPSNYAEHLANNSMLKVAYEHKATDCRDLTQRGEFLYTANGKGGFRVYDIANIDNKAFSERFNTSEVSPLGENLHVQTKGVATALALPSTLGLDPLRNHEKDNEETPIPLYYGFIYGTDTVEGLVEILVGTLVDGRPDNNFLHKDVVFNPDGLLNNATFLVAAGARLYITSPQGLSVVSVQDPLHPKLVSHYSGNFLKNPRAVAVQFQYAFVTDDEGLKVFNIDDPDHPEPIRGATLPLADAQRLYLARTYAYVANGKEGLAIVDIERPEHPKLFMMYNADGRINDARAVQVGSISASMFALVADGKNGFRVVQMISPENVPEHMGFSPKPNPILIATYPVKEGEVIAVGRGLDRDRVVDETGSQTVVFGRRGSRPFNLTEMAPFLRHHEDVYTEDQKAPRTGAYYRVEDVSVKKDENGKPLLMTRSGSELAAPAAFVDLSVTPEPSPAPGAEPASGVPEPGNEFMRQQDVKRLLRTLDPTRPADAPLAQPGVTPAPSPSAGSGNPYMQQSDVDRMLHNHQKPVAPPAATPATPPPLAATPEPSTPAPSNSGASFLQQGDVDRMLKAHHAASPTPAPSSSSPP
jgi:hypothetical protein